MNNFLYDKFVTKDLVVELQSSRSGSEMNKVSTTRKVSDPVDRAE